jgi:hypothetical protein
MAAKRKRRQHMAERLETRFQPLFWLARSQPLPWPVRTDKEHAEAWERLEDLARLLDRAGLSGSQTTTARDRAQARKNAFMREMRLRARWSVPDNDLIRSMENPAERLTWIVNGVRSHYAEGGWIQRVGQEGGAVGLLEALTIADKKWRADFLKWMQVSPVFVETVRARLVVKGAQVSLEPDPRDLHSCMWKLVAELIAGGWPVRRCAAPSCGKYIGQWTKRTRLFCDEGCRTNYHNALRAKRVRPAPTSTEHSIE